MSDIEKLRGGAFEIKSYTRKELNAMYGVPAKTFRRWLAPYSEAWGLTRQKYLTIEQVKKIITVLGAPNPIKKSLKGN